MKRMLWILVALFCSIYASAQVGILDGNLLDNKCGQQRRFDAGVKLNQEEFGDALFCIAYIRGVGDAIIVQDTMKVKLTTDEGEWAKPCFPSSVTNQQYIKVVLKYLADNPAKLHLPAYLLVLTALTEAFPCH